MKKVLLAIVMTLTSINNYSNGQNLVPNPSFEDTIHCPLNGRVSNCKYWINCGNTPDYDNACSPYDSLWSVPKNIIGFQYAATGNAYCEIWTYATTKLYREYIGVPLIHPMIIGYTYHVSFKCSPGTLNGYSLQSNKLGIRFSTIPYDSIHPAPTNNFAHIYTDSIIRDTTNWTLIAGDFTADSTYNFLTIGNFFDDSQTDTASVVPHSFFAVYYIDDVFVSDTINSIDELSKINEDIRILYNEKNIYLISLRTIKSIKIINVLGKLCFQSNERNTNLVILKENLSKGIYFVFIQTEDSNKIIKILIT